MFLFILFSQTRLNCFFNGQSKTSPRRWFQSYWHIFYLHDYSGKNHRILEEKVAEKEDTQVHRHYRDYVSNMSCSALIALLKCAHKFCRFLRVKNETIYHDFFFWICIYETFLIITLETFLHVVMKKVEHFNVLVKGFYLFRSMLNDTNFNDVRASNIYTSI